jgi:hypothetical protein
LVVGAPTIAVLSDRATQDPKYRKRAGVLSVNDCGATQDVPDLR